MGSTTDVVHVKINSRVATITINRPDKLNAMNKNLMEVLPGHIASVADNVDVGCVVITGSGRAFCAGGDIGEMAKRETSGEKRSLKHVHERQEASRLLHEMAKPTIAMINGVAVGAGLSIALACDIRLAASDARLSAGFARMALPGDYGGVWMAQRLVGSAKARELYFTADFIDAIEAERIGLVNQVVSGDQLANKTYELANRLAQGPPLALARMKQNMNLALTTDFKSLLEAEAEGIMLLGDSADHKEAVQAFIEKRPPEFRGQ